MTEGGSTGPLPDPPLNAGDLLGGEDADFVVNLYLALLGRWPDPAGTRRYLAMVAGQPGRRLEALREVAGSEEARRHGAAVSFAAGALVPPSATRAVAIGLGIRTAWLRGEVARLREAVGLLGGADSAAELIEARDAALRFELNALRREVGERLEATGLPAEAGARDTAVAAVAGLVARHAADLVAGLEAKFEARQRALEARLLALEARRG